VRPIRIFLHPFALRQIASRPYRVIVVTTLVVMNRRYFS
jgi:hypothetical protein